MTTTDVGVEPVAPPHLPRRGRGESKRLKIALLVRSLNYGGAERQLVVLAKGLHERGHSVVVVVFYPHGPLQKELIDTGVRVRLLAKRGRWDVARFSLQLSRVLREERPDVIQGCHGVANLMAMAMRTVVPRATIVCGVRCTNLEMAKYGWLTRAANVLADALRSVPDLFIANSQVAQRELVARGYSTDKIVVIPNGIDTDRFTIDRGAGRALRRDLGIADDELLVGRVGRIDPMKDHTTFLRAAAEVVKSRTNVRFVCVGDGEAEYRTQLQALGDHLGLGKQLLWLQAQRDMHAVYNALDIACSSSAFGEGFPNVVGEAMACGVPCVVTDVGDSAWVVGESAAVVKPRDPAALAHQLVQLVDRGSHELVRIGVASRDRIVNHFAIERLVSTTERVLNAAVEGSVA